MSSFRRRPVAALDKALDWCVENWHVLLVLLPAGTFVIFSLVLFFGLTVTEALTVAKALVAVEVTGAGVILVLNLKYRRRIREYLNAADAIEAVLGWDDAFSEWREFVAAPIGDRELERIRQHCLALPGEFPPATPGEYCGPQGVAVLERYIAELRAGLAGRLLLSLTGLVGLRQRPELRARRQPPDPATPDMVPLDDTPPAGSEPEATTATDEPDTEKKSNRRVA